ncbi:cache domain-containing protein [Mycobacterium sp. ACS4331]|uniref:cache domain-containing protein n=1 Tax=Mycobacterium sp. ACS4331 TaxID=1834121 RepID=UPI0007FEBD4F|nr:cache domain-containing protein [Mycobacterium sp. ACS4331]OBF27993.1 hypothetical protein A5727_02630 [Mycobacterium sp. ACS4331]
MLGGQNECGNLDVQLTQAAAHVAGVVEDIFSALRQGAAEAAALYSEVAEDGTVDPVQLAGLRPSIERRLAAHPHFDGTGLVVDPSVLRGVDRYQEWWRPLGDGRFEFLDVKTGFREEPYDYTTMSWFVGAAQGMECIRGPYVDLSGSDLYVLTFAVPAVHDGRFLGISGADVTVSSFEGQVIADLSVLDCEVVVVNSADRVVISSSPDYSPGERMRASTANDVHIGGPGVNWRVHRV